MMNSLKYFLQLGLIFTLLNTSCVPDEKSESSEDGDRTSEAEKNLNISLLLDLSDRIDTTKYPNSTMQYYQRDLGYIKATTDVLTKHIKTKRAFFINDNIGVFIDPEPKSAEVNETLEKLKFKFTKNTPDIINKVDNLSAFYNDNVEQLYSQSLEDNIYVGSDIWNFFKKNVKDFCVENDHNNILIILTDGYMYHQNSKYVEGNRYSYLTSSTISKLGLNSSKYNDVIDAKDYGFIATRSDLNDLQVLVIGVNPSTNTGNPYEADIIEAFWHKWLKEMGVQKAKIVQAELPTNAEKLIKDFVLSE